MGGGNPTASEVASRRKRVAEEYLRGVPQFKIAEIVGVHRGTITRDLAVIREEWKAAYAMAFGERVAQELAKLDLVELTYWEAWQRSLKDSERLNAKTVKNADGKVKQSEAVKQVEAQPGDPRFLEGVERCIKKRAEILGLNAPVKIRHGGDATAPPIAAAVKVKWEDALAKLPDDKLQQLKGVLDSVRGAGEDVAAALAEESAVDGVGALPAQPGVLLA